MAVRFLAVGCQAVTLAVTWDLWQVRDYPPLLPVGAWDVPQFDVGVLLLASLAAVLVAPRPGAWAHLGLLAYAVIADQTRLQPEVVSLAVLILATVLGPVGTHLARAHLVSLWAWSGLNKLLSLGFFTGSARWIHDGLPFEVAALRPQFGWIVAGMELAVGLVLLVRPARRLGVVLAFVLHGTILLVLSPWGHDWNAAVWPWNVALPVAAWAFFWPAATSEAVRHRRVPAIAMAVALVLPLGFYAGVLDTYLAHNLYADNAAAAFCTSPAGPCDSAAFGDTWTAFDVPLPPEPRLFTQWFSERCHPGEVLTITPRRVRVLAGANAAPVRHPCRDGDRLVPDAARG